MKKQPTAQEIEAALKRVSKEIAEKKRPLQEISLSLIDAYHFIEYTNQAWGEGGEVSFAIVVSTEKLLEKLKEDGTFKEVNCIIKNKVRELKDYNLETDKCEIDWVSREVLRRDFDGNIFNY
jgi:hypothetical protein